MISFLMKVTTVSYNNVECVIMNEMDTLIPCMHITDKKRGKQEYIKIDLKH